MCVPHAYNIHANIGTRKEKYLEKRLHNNVIKSYRARKNMKEPLILTIDFGTQSVRAGLFNKKGETVALIKEKYNPPYFSPKRGYAEQDPNFYFDSLCKATRKLVEENKDKMGDVLGITMAFFRDSVVCLDKDNNILRPAILWLDERRAKGEQKLPLLHRFLFQLVGMKPTIELNLKRSMAQWIKENQPEIWAKTDKFMMLSTFVTMRLIGQYVDSPCCQAGHLPINFKKGVWYKNAHKHMKGQIFGVKNSQLCELVPVGEVMGTITEEASKLTGLPVGMKMFAGGSDKSAETLGLGVIDDRSAAISYGTACTIEIPINKYMDAEPFLPSYPAIIKGYYNLDVQVYRGYWMLNWFAKEFGGANTIEKILSEKDTIESLNEEMMKIAPGSEGLVLQPYWGPGLRRPLAKGAIVGFSDTHTRIHMYRAIIEGIAYCLKEGLELFEKKRLHHKVERIRVSGGGSQSDAICQITADIFGLPVSKIQTYECSSLGCAIAGFIAAGEFKTPEEAAKAMVHQSTEFIPNPENVKKYEYLFKNAYMPMYPSLRGIYGKIKKYNDEF